MGMNLTALDEVIEARHTLHGGGKGAPIKLSDGSREGAALNKACVVLLSAELQSYVENAFISCSNKAFRKILTGQELVNYRATWSRWGNPNPANITALFRRIGMNDVLDELRWQGQSNLRLRTALDNINQVRNCIAHGSEIRVKNKPFSLQLIKISGWRNVMFQFGERFETHALDKIP